MSWSDPIREDGFAIIPDVFAPADMDRIIAEIEQCSPTRSRAGVRHALRLDPVAKIAHHQDLLDVVHGVLGAAAFPFHATLFEKSSNTNWLVVWHQDTALPLRGKSLVPGWGPWSVKDGVEYAHAPVRRTGQRMVKRYWLSGQTLAFCTCTRNGFGQIEVINADGSGRRQLTQLQGGAPFWC